MSGEFGLAFILKAFIATNGLFFALTFLPARPILRTLRNYLVVQGIAIAGLAVYLLVFPALRDIFGFWVIVPIIVGLIVLYAYVMLPLLDTY